MGKWITALACLSLLSSCSNTEKKFTAQCRTILDAQIQEARVNTGDDIKVSDFETLNYSNKNGLTFYVGKFIADGVEGVQDVRWVCSQSKGDAAPLVTVTAVNPKR
jgi:hypothetical protein